MNNENHPWESWETNKPEKPNNLSDLGGPEKKKYDRKIKKIRGERKVLKLIKKQLQDLLKKEECPKYGEKEINEILHNIYKDLSGYPLKYLHNFFIKGLEQYNKDNDCNIPIPNPINVIHRVKSPFRYEGFHKLGLLKSLVKKFKLSIDDPLFFDFDSNKYTKRREARRKTQDSNHFDLWVGQIIFSSIYNGALLNMKLIYALLDGIREQSIIVEEGYIWFDLKVSKKTNDENKVLRRWFLDSVSALLILRLFNAENERWIDHLTTLSEEQYAQKSFKLYLCSLGLRTSDQPSLSQFMDTSSIKHYLYLPPYLVNIAKKFELAPSMSAETWVRLRMNLRLKEVPEDLVQENEKVADDATNLYAITSISKQEISKNTPKNAGAKKAIRCWLNQNTESSSVIQALAEWCLVRLTDQLHEKRILPSSMKTYLSSIGRPLIMGIKNKVFTEFETDDWETVYSNILKNAKNPHSTASLLIKFHKFLVSKYDVLCIDIEYTGDRLSIRPNVNLLSAQEYQSTFNYLENYTSFSKRLKKMQQLLLILGYRCGLRKTEALTLHVQDLQTVNTPQCSLGVSSLRPELLIRNNLYATVKNNSSVRRIPLALFLNDAELKLLLDWKTQRLRELATTHIKNQLLFCNLGEDDTVLTTKDTASHIQGAMRYITGDSRLRFHHLRHSFANFSLLKLLSYSSKNLIPAHWEDNKKDLVNFPRNLTPKHILLSPNKKSRRLLFAVSTICGHIDPKETIQTYIHLLDWVLIHELRKHEQPLSLATQENLLGLTNSSLRSLRSRGDFTEKSAPSDILKIATKKYEKKYCDPVLKHTEKPKSIPAQPSKINLDEEYPSPFVLYSLFHKYYQNQDAKKISQQYGYPVSKVKHWIENAKTISNASSPRKLNSRFVRAKFKKLTKKQLVRWPTLDGLSPALPRSVIDRVDAKEIYFKLLAFYEQEPEHLLEMMRLYWKRASFEKNFFMPRNDPSDHEQEMLLQLLNKMGIAKYRKRVHFEPDPNKDSDKQLKYWKKLYNLLTENFHITERTSGQSTQNKNGKARIWISKKGTKYPNEGKNKYKPNESIRFALYMVMVVITPE